MKKILLLLFFLSSAAHAQVQTYPDSAFLVELKQFVLEEIGETPPPGRFYRYWGDGRPLTMLFVSEPDRIKRVDVEGRITSHDSIAMEQRAAELRAIGYHVFVYKTYATSATHLNFRFLMYTREAKAFIVFHEIMHAYVARFKEDLPYSFHEALCDVVGNYGSLRFFDERGGSTRAVKRQMKLNESLYETLNDAIERINGSPASPVTVALETERKITRLLRHGDEFQHDRFNYPVNNGYFLKNYNYCWNYFLLQQVLSKKKSIREFLVFVRQLPDLDESALRQYLIDYLNGKQA